MVILKCPMGPSICSLSTGESEAGAVLEFEATLDYRVRL